MAKRLRDPKTGQIVRIDFEPLEMAEILEVSNDDLASWDEVVKPRIEAGNVVVYSVRSIEDLNMVKKRVSLLKTRMSQAAVINVEKAGLLDAYAALAKDCPTGVTAHVWRSYGLVVLMQVRYGKMIDAAELAKRAGLTERNPESGKVELGVELARKHLRILIARNLLKPTPERWEHKGLPESWSGI